MIYTAVFVSEHDILFTVPTVLYFLQVNKNEKI